MWHYCENAVNGNLSYRQKEQLSTGPTDKFVHNEDSSGLAQFKKIDGKLPEDNILLPSQLEKQVVGQIKHGREVIRKAEAARRAKAMESARLEIEQQQQTEGQLRKLWEQARRVVVDQAEMARLRQAELPRSVTNAAALRSFEPARRPQGLGSAPDLARGF